MRLYRKIPIFCMSAVLCLCLAVFGSGCASGGHALTVENEQNQIVLLEPLQRKYAAGEKITVKIAMMTDCDVTAYLNEKSLGKQTPVKEGDTYTHWEYYFTMPDCDAVLRFVISDGFFL